MIFNDINVNGRQIWEKEHHDVSKKKKIELVFEVGLPANETQFSKAAITKYYTFFSHKLMLMLVNINGNGHRQIRCVL